MRLRLIRYSFLLSTCCFAFAGCLHDKYEEPQPAGSSYPDDVAAIITNKCATPGCHNTVSSSTAGGVDFTSPSTLLNGSVNGAVLIPYRPDLSSMLYFTNVDSSLGLIQIPTMPVNSPPLSQQEYLTLRNWIAMGAPDKEGVIPFADNPMRKKFYVVNAGCDLLAVYDADKRVVMRYYDIGVLPAVKESPYDVKVTPDGNYFLVAFSNADIVQLFSTQNDQLIASIPIGSGIPGKWNTIVVSNDSRKAYAIDYTSGRVAFIDLISKTSFTSQGFAPSLCGASLNKTSDTLYLTEDLGNRLFIIPVNDTAGYISLNLRSLVPEPGTLNIHDIKFNPDYSKYFVTCSNVNQIWVFDAATNTLIDTLHVMDAPLQLAFSTNSNYLFTTCGIANGVEVINYQTLAHIKRIPVGESPHGIALDDEKGLVYVLNRSGHSHHPAICAGVNGSMNTITMSTLERLVREDELSVEPYQIAVRP